MSDLIGLDAQTQTLLAAAASGRMHHGWILAGPRGIGKATLARAVATRLLVEAADPAFVESGLFGNPPPPTLDVPVDHAITRLMDAESHPDFIRLRRLPRDEKKAKDGVEKAEPDESDLKRNISIDQVRGLHRLLNNRPSLSERRIVIIDSADDLERPAANALLKSLEEPPSGTLFLLISHAPGRLLPTIRSRCRLLQFSSLSDADMRTIIRRRLPEADAQELDALAKVGSGSPGRALGFAGLGMAEIDATLAAIARDGDPGNDRRLAMARSLALKSAKSRYEAFLERAPAFIAQAAKARAGQGLATALDAWEESTQLSASALIINLDPTATVFELCSQVARLSQTAHTA